MGKANESCIKILIIIQLQVACLKEQMFSTTLDKCLLQRGGLLVDYLSLREMHGPNKGNHFREKSTFNLNSIKKYPGMFIAGNQIAVLSYLWKSG